MCAQSKCRAIWSTKPLTNYDGRYMYVKCGEGVTSRRGGEARDAASGGGSHSQWPRPRSERSTSATSWRRTSDVRGRSARPDRTSCRASHHHVSVIRIKIEAQCSCVRDAYAMCQQTAPRPTQLTFWRRGREGAQEKTLGVHRPNRRTGPHAPRARSRCSLTVRGTVGRCCKEPLAKPCRTA